MSSPASSPDFAVHQVPLYTQVPSNYPDFGETSRWSREQYGNGRYDCTDSQANGSSTIRSCGCAITSEVMVSNYYGASSDLHNNPVTPENFNNWLYSVSSPTSTIGYTKGGTLWWQSIDQYTNGQVVFINVATSTNQAFLNSKLDNEVNSLKPAILSEPTVRHGHYIVGDSKLASTYHIRDPYFYQTQYLNGAINSTTQHAYGNSFYGVYSFGRGTLGLIPPSISYAVSSPAELLVTDPSGRRLGLDPSTNTSYNEIPGGSYFEDSVGGGPDDATTTGHIVKTIWIPSPSSGPYALSVIGTGSGSYTIDSLVYGTSNDSHTASFTGNTAPNVVAGYNLNFTPDQPQNISFVPSDTTPPVIVPTVTPSPNDSGWNNADVVVTWNVTDPESAITSSSGCDSTTLTDETSGTTLTCTATSAGGTDSQSVTIKIDKTKPVITGTQTPLANGAGWNNADVTVDFTCAETGAVQSDIATDTVAGETLNTEGTGQSVTNTGNCVDAAGNIADSATVSGINIDKMKPITSADISPEPDTNGWNNTDVSVTFNGSDDLSGIDNCAAPITLSSEGAGQSASGTCTDKAGNTSDLAIASINIDKTAPVITAGTQSGTLGLNGWYVSAVTVPFIATDNLSGFSPATTLSIDLASKATVGEGNTLTVTSDAATDLTGNTSPGLTAGPFKVDVTPPIITFDGASPAANGAGWNNTSVTLTWSCSDPVSGVITNTVSKTISTEGRNQSASGTCTDNAGLTSTDTRGGINIDKTAPAITITTPTATNYTLNQVVSASYNCADSASGVASCVGSVPNGSPINMSSVGTKSFTVTATDVAANISNPKVVNYNIGYHFGGFLPPVEADGSGIYKLGRTLPIKFKLADTNGNLVSTAVAHLVVTNVQNGIVGTNPVDLATSTKDTGNFFRYADSQYIYNFDTSQLTTGTWQLQAVLDDGNNYNVLISLR